MAQPASPEVTALVTDLTQRLHEACSSSGFCHDITGAFELEKLEVFDVVEDPDTDTGTRPLKGASARLVHRLKVTDNMCNLGMNMHGGCQAFLLDICTSLAMVTLRGPGSWETSGVTSSLGCNYFKAIPLGAEVLLVSTVISKGARLAVIDFRIEDDAGNLYTQGTHTKMDDTAARRQRREQQKKSKL